MGQTPDDFFFPAGGRSTSMWVTAMGRTYNAPSAIGLKSLVPEGIMNELMADYDTYVAAYTEEN